MSIGDDDDFLADPLLIGDADVMLLEQTLGFRLKTVDEFMKIKDTLSDEEIFDYYDKIMAEFAEMEAARGDRPTVTWLETHDFEEDLLTCGVIAYNLPPYFRGEQYEEGLKFSMNAALSEVLGKEDDYVSGIALSPPDCVFVMKTQEYAQAAFGLGTIEHKGVEIGIRER